MKVFELIGLLLILLLAIYGMTDLLVRFLPEIVVFCKRRKKLFSDATLNVLNLEEVTVENKAELLMLNAAYGNIYYQKDIDKFLKNVTGKNGSDSDWAILGGEYECFRSRLNRTLPKRK